jgi:hypothetical protein
MSDQPETATTLAHARHARHHEVLAQRSQFYQGSFGRLFRNLPPWTPEGTTEVEQIQAIFEIAQASFEARPDIVDGEPDTTLDNPKIPAAYTYFGQFIDHDITFDPTSSLQRRNDPERLYNFRTPRFDLDCIYGRGPDDQPYLYSQGQRGKLLVGANGSIPEGDLAKGPEPDLPRNNDASKDPPKQDGFNKFRVALIGDPRNDENIIVSQIQLAVIKFHNARIDEGRSFEEARRLTRWHYQWVVVHDFLKKVCGKAFVDSLLTSPTPGKPTLRFYDFKEQPFIPVEFAVAAYRMGHSMVRTKYHLSKRLTEIRKGAPLDIFGGELKNNLQGGRELPGFWTIQWDLFVEFNGSNPQLSRLIDNKLAPPLVELPLVTDDKRFQSLPFRNLLRSWRLELPSGQDVARRMGIANPIDEDQHDPLWIYILKEAVSNGEHGGKGGRRLGTVGATIVGEVFVGLLAADPSSYYATNPTWEPKGGKSFDLAAFLKMAGAPMTEDDITTVQKPIPIPV